MYGSATLAIEVSSTSMNVASVTVRATTQWLTGAWTLGPCAAVAIAGWRAHDPGDSSACSRFLGCEPAGPPPTIGGPAAAR